MSSVLIPWSVMVARLRATDYELASQKLLVVEFLHRSFCFIHGEHLYKGKTFRALVVFVADHLGVLDLSDAVEELEQVALGCVERQVADVKTRRSDFDCFRLARWSRLVRAVA